MLSPNTFFEIPLTDGRISERNPLHPTLIMHSEVIGTTISLEMLIFGFQKNVVRISRKSVTHNPLEDRLSSLSSGLSLAHYWP